MNGDRELNCPNPECRGSAPPAVVGLHGSAHRVECRGCGLTGPVVGGKGQAVGEWGRIRFDRAGKETDND